MSENKKTDLALLKASDLAKVENSVLNPFQLQMLLKKTPGAYVKKRPAKGGGQWSYVSGGYVRKCLNILFGWDWDFEIIDKQLIFNQVIVEGKLTCRSNGSTIVKMQIGGKEVVFKKGTQDPLNIANDFKAAATDALKKCAAEIGIAADIYNAAEFKEVDIDLTNELTPSEIKRIKEIERLTLLINSCVNIESLNEYLKYTDEYPEINQVLMFRNSELKEKESFKNGN